MERKTVGLQIVLVLVLAAACDDREFIVGGWQVRHVGADAGHRDAGAAPVTGPVTADTPIAGCRAYKTVGEMDRFFALRCGAGAVCHATSPFGDFKSPNVFERVADQPSVNCGREAKLADTSNWSNSLLWLKARDAPRCPNGSVAGLTMPSAPSTRLDAEELACLEGFLKALSGGK